MFENFSLNYAQPSPDSIVINRGSISDTPTDDLLGRIRDSSPDVGAVEAQSSPGNPTTPTNTSLSFISALLLLLYE